MLSQRPAFAGTAPSPSPAAWLVVSGYPLLEAAGAALAARLGGIDARRALLGCAVPAGQLTAWTAAARACRPSMLIVNDREGAELLGATTGDSAEEIGSLAHRLAGSFTCAAMVTDAGGAAACWPGDQPIVVAGTVGETAVVDTTGAGDAFAARVIVELATGAWPPPSASVVAALHAAVDHACLGDAGIRCAGAHSRREAPGDRGRRYARRMTDPRPTPAWLAVSDEVALALTDRAPVVALESSLIAQGLPAPHNVETARAAEAAVRAAGAVPATVAIEDGMVVVGAPDDLLDRLADPDRHPAKAASRDIGPLVATRRLAATTVSATMRAAHAAGIRCFATGGIGGVHRGAGISWDVSSDIDELAATPVAVICSGAKSILDLPATLELLETRRVPLIGLGTDRLPAFYSADAGLAVPHRAADAAEAARMIAAHLAIAGAGGLLVVQPAPAAVAIPFEEVEAWIVTALEDAEHEGMHGGAVTPFVLGRVAAASGGRTLRANVALIVNNAAAAARIAVALSQR